jgi:hypothetical protein
MNTQLTKIVHGKVYLFQHVINFVSDSRQVSGFLRVLRFPPPIKLTVKINLKNIVESGVKNHKLSFLDPYWAPWSNLIYMSEIPHLYNHPCQVCFIWMNSSLVIMYIYMTCQ